MILRRQNRDLEVPFPQVQNVVKGTGQAGGLTTRLSEPHDPTALKETDPQSAAFGLLSRG
jgi:hypothetical protein